MTATRRQFMYRAGLAGVTLAVPTWVWGCGGSATPNAEVPASPEAPATPVAAASPEAWAEANPEWEARVAQLEGEGIYTTETPGPWEGKAGSHVPQVTFTAGEGKVELLTAHGMSPEHYITAHYLRDQDGRIIGLQAFQGTDPEARSSFELPPGTTSITAYSHCNQHDDWSAVASAD